MRLAGDNSNTTYENINQNYGQMPPVKRPLPLGIVPVLLSLISLVLSVISLITFCFGVKAIISLILSLIILFLPLNYNNKQAITAKLNSVLSLLILGF